jgi:hypothetical protein
MLFVKFPPWGREKQSNPAGGKNADAIGWIVSKQEQISQKFLVF